MVRSENSVVVRSDMDLAPLYSVQTGELIDDCPRTLGDLESLGGMCFFPVDLLAVCLLFLVPAVEAATILRLLGESVPRGISERRRLLKFAFGVRTRAV